MFENYAEMVQLETQLKKVGFDTVGIGSELSLGNQILELNPSVIVAYGQGNRVNTLSVAKKLKDMVRWTGKVILIFPEAAKPAADDLIKIRMDMIVEAPPKVERLLQVIAKLRGMDEVPLLEKLKNISYDDGSDHMFKGQLHQNETFFVTGQLDEDTRGTFKGNIINSVDESAQKKKFDLKNESTEAKASGKKSKKGSQENSEKKFQIQDESEQENRISSVEEPAGDDQASKKSIAGDDASQILEFLAKQDENKKQFKNKEQKSKEKNEELARVETLVKPEVHMKNKESATQIDDENHIRKTKGERDLSEETQKALAEGQSRIEKYKNFLTNLVFQPQSTVQRKLTRRVQQELMQGISVQEVENQDERRRDFTRALFQKRK